MEYKLYYIAVKQIKVLITIAIILLLFYTIFNNNSLSTVIKFNYQDSVMENFYPNFKNIKK